MKKTYLKKQVIFVESGLVDMCAKMAFVLRKKGYETVLVALTGDVETDFYKKAYNKRISFNFKFFKFNLKNFPRIFLYGIKKFSNIIKSLNNIRKLKPYVVIGRATPNWMCVLTKKYFRKYPFIYFPYDIRSFGYDNLEEVRKARIPAFEIKAEKYCFENADGIIHKGDENELKYLPKKVLGDIKIKSPVLHFLPYCLKELITPINKNKLSKKDKEIHMVHVGHVDNGKRWIDPLKEITSQGIHAHLYAKTAYLSKKEVYHRISEGYKELLKNKYFHLHNPVDQKSLSKEISKYDFGLWYGAENINKKAITMTLGNKISSYFEAGLPFTYFKNIKYLDKLMKKYKTNLTINSYKNLKKNLEKLNYNKLVKNIEAARNKFEMHKQIPRLEKFLENVIKYKKQLINNHMINLNNL